MSARTTLWVLLVLLVLLGAGVARSAWVKWPSVLRYRIRRIDAQTTALVQGYLDGRQALEPAARELANLYAEKTMLSSRLVLTPPPGGGVLQAVVIAVPSGLSPDDPRMKLLGNRMWQYMPSLEAMDGLRATR